MSAIETSHLNKSYRGRKIVDDVSICVREGDIYGLVGRNGAGKTTLIRMILGLASPDSGEIKINNAVSADALNYERKKIGAIVDVPSILPHLSALENMKAAALSFGSYDENKLREILRNVELNADDRLPAKNFSLGMKQRLAIGLALIGEPSILILDEPVNGLDPMGIFEVRELLQRLNREQKVTIMISSHLLAELGKLATCYGIMEGGKLIREMRGSDLDEMCRPYIKVVVGDWKNALHVIAEHFHAHEFEILPYNTLAIYDLSKGVAGVANIFTKANVPVISISQCEGDLESTFISLMGGTGNDEHK